MSFGVSTHYTCQGTNAGISWLIGHISQLAPLVDNLQLHNNNGWLWHVGKKDIRSWSFNNKTWRVILNTSRTDFVKLNAHWLVNLIVVDWIHFWKKLWGSSAFYRDKVYLQRVLNHGYLHHRMACIWGVHFGLCPCYSSQPKTIDHLFFGCRDLHNRWATLAVIFVGSTLALVFYHNNLWGIIHFGILRSCRSPILLVIIIDMLHNIWLERNTIHYKASTSQLPIHTLLQQSVKHVNALMDV